jgi:hypothetical protein
LLHDLGRHVTRIQAVRPQAVARVFGVQHPGHPMHRTLGHRVGDAPATFTGRSLGYERRRARRELHEHTATARDHSGQELLQQHERGDGITFDDPSGELHRKVDDAVVDPRTLVDRVRDQGVHGAEAFTRRSGGGSHGDFVGEIHGHREDIGSEGPTLRRRRLDRTAEFDPGDVVVLRRTVEHGATAERTSRQHE